MKIAVASTDGNAIDEHFGRANRFWIFELAEGQPKLIMVTQVEQLSEGDPKHSFNSERFEQIYRKLADCQKIFVYRIGDRPLAELRERGKEVVVTAGPIAALRS